MPARLLVDVNTEFETQTDPVPVLADRFARILTDPDAFAVLASGGAQDTGSARCWWGRRRAGDPRA